MKTLADLQREGDPKDAPKWVPTDDEKKKLMELTDEFDISTRFRSFYEDQWTENIERWEAKPFYNEDGSAGINLPICKWVIETKQAIEMKAPPTFAYEPAEDSSDERIVQILEKVVKKHVWNQKYVNLNYKLDVLNQDKDILGTMYQYIGWKRIYRTIRTEEGGKINTEPSEDGKIVFETKTAKKYSEKSKLFYDDVYVENIYPQDVWLHPLAMGVFDSPWIKIRKRYSYSKFLELHSDPEMFKNIDAVKAGKWSMVKDDNSTYYQDYAADDKDQVVVFEHWNIMRDELVIIANGVIIHEGNNPFDHKELPFTDFIDRLKHKCYLGEGEPERIASLVDAINAFVNISIDKEKMSASGLNLLDEGLSDFDDVANMFDPRTAIRVADPKNTFHHIELPGMSASTDRMLSLLMDYLIFATGVDFRQLVDMGSSTQATVAAIRREISQIRLGLNVRRNENRGYQRLGWLLAKTVQQFYPEPRIEEVTGIETGELRRTIKVEGEEISEKPIGNANGEDIYGPASLVVKGKGQGKYGFFKARPEYLRTKGDIHVRVISESSFAASKELQKAKAAEYVDIANKTVEVMPDGTQKKVVSVKYGMEQYVKAMDYDMEKAFDIEGKDKESTARNIAKAMIPGFDGAPSPTAAGEGNIQMKGSMPPTEGAPPMTGANSEPVQKLKAELGNANKIQ